MATVLFIVKATITKDKEEAFNRWYNEEHIRHLLKVPGFLSAGRYEALSGGPKYLAMYELEEPGVRHRLEEGARQLALRVGLRGRGADEGRQPARGLERGGHRARLTGSRSGASRRCAAP